MNQNLENRQINFAQDSELIAPRNHEEQNDRIMPDYRQITNQILQNAANARNSRNLRVRLPTDFNLSMARSEIIWYLFSLYLIFKLVGGDISTFGVIWMIGYILFGSWMKRSLLIEKIGNMMHFIFFFTAVLSWSLFEHSSPDIILYLVICVISLMDCLFISVILLIIIGIILLILGILVAYGTLIWVKRKIRKFLLRKRSQRMIDKICQNEFENSESKECSICLEIDGKICQLQCSHYFHKTCISQWLKDHQTCPVCRNQLY